MSGAYAEIEGVAGVLKAYPEMTITIEGYTDANGAAEYNYKLSERRAVAVKNALVNAGIDP
jgi:outer membrane protein OmpA-like peptidoglycan-associated protein